MQSGKFASASEVVRAALRMFEHEETKKDELVKELKKGESIIFVLIPIIIRFVKIRPASCRKTFLATLMK